MKTLTEKQILEWKEELAKQKTQKEQAERVLEQTLKTIDMIEGGIQFAEMLLKKNESEDSSVDKQESTPKSEAAPSK